MTMATRPSTVPQDPALRILVVESDGIVARAVLGALERARYEVAGPVSSSGDALAVARTERLALALVEVVPGDGRGADLVSDLYAQHRVPCVIVGTDIEAGTLEGVGAAAAGILVKPFQEAQLLATVFTATRVSVPDIRPDGGDLESTQPDGSAEYLSAREQRIRQAAAAIGQNATADRPLLSARELHVIKLLLANGHVQTIAEALQISPPTVRNHLRSVFEKLGVHSQQELISEIRRAAT